jgi:hypothetical protein
VKVYIICIYMYGILYFSSSHSVHCAFRTVESQRQNKDGCSAAPAGLH